MKKLFIIAIIAVMAGGAYYLINLSEPESVNKMPASSYKNISYGIEGENIQLTDGLFEAEAAPGSAEIISTQYFGNEARGDFNNDGTEDVVFILTQSGGGTGIFYYAVAALKVNGIFRGTNAIFLGDRIAPQTTEFRDGRIIVNYADRNPGEPFSADPSRGVSKYLQINGESLVEVAN